MSPANQIVENVRKKCILVILVQPLFPRQDVFMATENEFSLPCLKQQLCLHYRYVIPLHFVKCNCNLQEFPLTRIKFALVCLQE